MERARLTSALDLHRLARGCSGQAGAALEGDRTGPDKGGPSCHDLEGQALQQTAARTVQSDHGRDVATAGPREGPA